MPAPADERLRRCDLRLYASDWDWLYRRYGHGVTDRIRQLVRKHRREVEAGEIEMKVIGGEKDE